MQIDYERIRKTMHNKMAAVAICMAAFAMGAAAQVTGSGTAGTVPVFTGSGTSIGNSSAPITVSSTGNVGIGTGSPVALLDVRGRADFSTSGGLVGIDNDYNGNNVGFYWNSYWTGTSGNVFNYKNTGWWGGTAARLVGNGSILSYDQASGGTSPITWTNRLTINSSGNVGIGTTSPGAKLEVSGSLKLTANSGGAITFQDGTTQSTAYTGVTCGGDYAESVAVTGNRTNYEPGDLLVIDPDVSGKFLKSVEPYSTSVSGIYSTKPGTVGRRQTSAKSPDEVPMAVVGVVPATVSAENGAIHPGDLLVSSSKIGYAMKGTDRSQMLGAVIGKAMGNLDSGTGVIEVLVTLQ